jgi:hypothetical protein
MGKGEKRVFCDGNGGEKEKIIERRRGKEGKDSGWSRMEWSASGSGSGSGSGRSGEAIRFTFFWNLKISKLFENVCRGYWKRKPILISFHEIQESV